MHSRFSTSKRLATIMAGALPLLSLMFGQPQPVALAAAPHPRTIDFADAHVTPTVGELKTTLTNMESGACPAGKPILGSVSFTKAISAARLLEQKAGAGAVHKVETGRDADPATAEVDASGAMMAANPLGALAALLAGYDHDKTDPTLLRNMGAVLAQLSMPQEALAVLARADTLKGKPQKPAGISELDSELNNKGFALIQLRRWNEAGRDLAKAVADQPLLSEAKTNLSLVDLCTAKPGKAAAMLFAGVRRNPEPKFDETGFPPYKNEQASLRTMVDVSHGLAGTMPRFVYPRNMNDIDQDGPTFQTVMQSLQQAEARDSSKVSSLLTGLPPRPRAEVQRVNDIGAAESNAQMGGFADLENATQQAEMRESTLWMNTFGGQCGDACEESLKIQAAGGDPCTVQHPKMRRWLDGRNALFFKDITAWDQALRKQWRVESTWATALIANIANPKVNQALALGLDEDKQGMLSLMVGAASDWERFATTSGDLGCADSTGPGDEAPAETMDHPLNCPASLKEHSFSFSVGVLELDVNCETISITAEEEGLGPFGRIAVSRNGAVTVTAGAHAGVSLGPASAGVEAGVYVTVDSSGIKDVGVTASATATASSHNIGLQVAGADYTASFMDSTGYAAYLTN